MHSLRFRQISLRTALVLIAVFAILVAIYPQVFPKPEPVLKPYGYLIKGTDVSPPCSIYWFRDSDDKVVSGFVAFGENRPQTFISSDHGDIQIPTITQDRIQIPRDGTLYGA